MTDKRCSKCKETFPATADFFRIRGTGKNGLDSRCKKCVRQYEQTFERKARNAICTYCQKPFYKDMSQPTIVHCSRECKDSYYADLRQAKGKRTEKDYNRKQKTYTCKSCGQEFIGYSYRKKVYCSSDCRCNEMQAIGRFHEKIKKQHRTDIEAITERVLQELDIAYEFEKRFGRYWVDFYLPDYHLAIECDGMYWHNSEHDQKRDAALNEKHHIRVQRFTQTQIRGNIRDLLMNTLAS